MEHPTREYGLHLTIDAYGADPLKLGDAQYVKDFLASIPGTIGMHLLWGPHIEEIKDDSGHEPGVSVILMIYESHMTIHTYPKKDFFTMDVYSCNMFDHQKVIEMTKKTFTPTEVEVNTVIRCKKFPVSNLHD